MKFLVHYIIQPGMYIVPHSQVIWEGFQVIEVGKEEKRKRKEKKGRKEKRKEKGRKRDKKEEKEINEEEKWKVFQDERNNIHPCTQCLRSCHYSFLEYTLFGVFRGKFWLLVQKSLMFTRYYDDIFAQLKFINRSE